MTQIYADGKKADDLVPTTPDFLFALSANIYVICG